MHPHRKLHYFLKVGWEPDWIESSETILQDEFERSYADISLDNEDDELDVSGTKLLTQSSMVRFSLTVLLDD